MSNSQSRTNPAVATSLAAWHAMIDRHDMAALPDILHPDAIFRSPMAFPPYRSAKAVAMVIGTVIDVFEDFSYDRSLASDDGLSVVLEFSARVGDKELKGIDLIRFDEAGKIVEFEVMIRPLNSLQALGMEMGKRLGQHLPAFKDSSKPA